MPIVDISEVLLHAIGQDSETAEERALALAAIKRAEGAVKRYLGYDPVHRRRVQYYPQTEFVTPFGTISELELSGDKTQAIVTTYGSVASEALQVSNLPIRTIHNIWVNNDARGVDSRFTNAHKKVAATASAGGDYWPNMNLQDSDGSQLCTDGIILSYGLWPLARGSIKIDYTAGYLTKEFQGESNLIDASPIWDATLVEAVRRLQEVFVNKKKTGVGFTSGPLQSERLGDYSYSIGGAGGRGSSADRKFGGVNDLLPESMAKLADFVNYGVKLAS